MNIHIGGNVIDVVEPTTKMREAMEDAKVHLSLASPLFSYTITAVDRIIFSNFHPRACAIVHDDMNIVCFNPDFFMNTLKDANERAFVLYHELDHIFFSHVQRMNEMGYSHKEWNNATDLYINLNASGIFANEGSSKPLINERYQKYMTRPSCVLFDMKYLGMSSDDIYDLLKEESKGGGSSGDGNPPEGGDQSDGGSGQGGGDGGDPSEGPVGGDFDAIIGNGGSVEKLVKNEQTLKAAAVFTEMTSNGVSNTIGERFLIDRINNLRKPQVRWIDKISANLKHAVKTRYTYNRWSTKSSPMGGVIFPSYTGERVKIVFAVDTSGSMRLDDYEYALSELQGVLNSFEAWEVEYVQCDTTAKSVGRFTSDDNPDMKEWAMAVFGGNGTRMSVVIEHVNELYNVDAEEFDAVIILTDGLLMRGDVDDTPSVVDNVIVVSTRNDSLELKQAEVIILENESKK